MAEFGVGFKMYADSSGFVGGMREAGESAKKLKRDLGDTFGESSIFKNLTVVGAVTSIVTGLNAAGEAAQKLRDEAIKLGKDVPESVTAVARLGDGIDFLVSKTKDFGMALAAVPATMGERFANTILYLFKGVGKDQRELMEQIGRDADEAEKRLKKVREANAPEKIAEAESKLAAIRAENAAKSEDAADRMIALSTRRRELEEEIAKVGERTVKGIELQGEVEKVNQRILEENAKNRKEVEKGFQQIADDHMKQMDRQVTLQRQLDGIKRDGLPIDEQIRITQKEIAEITKQIKEGKEIGVEVVGYENQLLEKTIELTKLKAEAEKAAADEAERAAKGIKVQVQETEKLRIMAPIRGGAQFNELSDEALREIIRRNEQQARDITNPALAGIAQAGFNVGEASRLRFEAQNAQAILQSREDLRRDVRLMGVEGARMTFRGDPTQFDALVQRFVQDTRTNQDIARETNQSLADINARLLRAGFSK